MATRTMAELERLFQALADGTRLRILGLLLTGEVCVCDIHETLKIPQPTASRHLAYLRRTGLVDTRRDGLWVHYRVSESLPPHVRHALDGVLHAGVWGSCPPHGRHALEGVLPAVRHCPEPASDDRQLARATGRPRRGALP